MSDRRHALRKTAARRRLTTAAALLLLAGLASACGGVRISRDPLVADLPAVQADVCRQAVRDELRRRNVQESWVGRVSYVRRYANQGASSRVIGYNAWVYPRHGEGALVIELNEACQVSRVSSRGLR